MQAPSVKRSCGCTCAKSSQRSDTTDRSWAVLSVTCPWSAAEIIGSKFAALPSPVLGSSDDVPGRPEVCLDYGEGRRGTSQHEPSLLRDASRLSKSASSLDVFEPEVVVEPELERNDRGLPSSPLLFTSCAVVLPVCPSANDSSAPRALSGPGDSMATVSTPRKWLITLTNCITEKASHQTTPSGNATELTSFSDRPSSPEARNRSRI